MILNDVANTIDYALQSYVDDIQQNAEIEGTDEFIARTEKEREELEIAWGTIKSYLKVSGVYMPQEKENE